MGIYIYLHGWIRVALKKDPSTGHQQTLLLILPEWITREKWISSQDLLDFCTDDGTSQKVYVLARFLVAIDVLPSCSHLVPSKLNQF